VGADLTLVCVTGGGAGSCHLQVDRGVSQQLVAIQRAEYIQSVVESGRKVYLAEDDLPAGKGTLVFLLQSENRRNITGSDIPDGDGLIDYHQEILYFTSWILTLVVTKGKGQVKSHIDFVFVFMGRTRLFSTKSLPLPF